MDSSEGDVEVSCTDVPDRYVCWCVTRTHSFRPSSLPPFLPSTPPPPPGLRESPLLPFILQDPTASTPELRRAHFRFGEVQDSSRVSKEFIHRSRLSSSSISPTSCLVLALSIKPNLVSDFKGGEGPDHRPRGRVRRMLQLPLH